MENGYNPNLARIQCYHFWTLSPRELCVVSIGEACHRDEILEIHPILHYRNPQHWAIFAFWWNHILSRRLGRFFTISFSDGFKSLQYTFLDKVAFLDYIRCRFLTPCDKNITKNDPKITPENDPKITNIYSTERVVGVQVCDNFLWLHPPSKPRVVLKTVIDERNRTIHSWLTKVQGKLVPGWFPKGIQRELHYMNNVQKCRRKQVI